MEEPPRTPTKLLDEENMAKIITMTSKILYEETYLVARADLDSQYQLCYFLFLSKNSIIRNLISYIKKLNKLVVATIILTLPEKKPLPSV